MVPLAIGFALGLVPLIAGIIKKRVRLGILGLVISTVGGALLGVVLSIPTMAIFTWLIVRDGFVAEDALPQESSTDGPPEDKVD
jgi:hypothetical protein